MPGLGPSCCCDPGGECGDYQCTWTLTNSGWGASADSYANVQPLSTGIGGAVNWYYWDSGASSLIGELNAINPSWSFPIANVGFNSTLGVNEHWSDLLAVSLGSTLTLRSMSNLSAVTPPAESDTGWREFDIELSNGAALVSLFEVLDSTRYAVAAYFADIELTAVSHGTIGDWTMEQTIASFSLGSALTGTRKMISLAVYTQDIGDTHPVNCQVPIYLYRSRVDLRFTGLGTFRSEFPTFGGADATISDLRRATLNRVC